MGEAIIELFTIILGEGLVEAIGRGIKWLVQNVIGVPFVFLGALLSWPFYFKRLSFMQVYQKGGNGMIGFMTIFVGGFLYLMLFS